ncbi:MAG TPA: SgcJ/EcaC family oxidoreductase [Burkholderiales bacterium]|nr:SgcJ/EcaC family oxidoreductase [Burkholderiales bacterium]
MSRLALVCLALAAANGCGPSPQNGGDSSAAESAIQAASEAWISAWERGDADTLANLYEQDAMYAANTGEVLEGRDGIREGVRAWVAERPADIDLQVEVQPVRFVFRDDDAHTVSRFVVRAMPAGCSLQAGHALATWHRQSDGAWLIETQLVNRDPQPAADACARQASIVPDGQSLSTLRSHPAYADRPVVLVNLLDFASDEARARYLNEYAGPALELISAHGGSLLWAGPIDQQLVGDAGGEWDYAAFVRWPSRAAFVSMIESDDYRTLHDVRQETLRSTAIMVASDAGLTEE